MRTVEILLVTGCVFASYHMYAATYFCETCEDKSIAAGERSKDTYNRYMNRGGRDGRDADRGNNYYYQQRGNEVNYNRNNNNDTYWNNQNPNYYYNDGSNGSYYDQNAYTRPPSRAARSIMDTDVAPMPTDIHQADHEILDNIRETIENNTYSNNYKNVNVTISKGVVTLTGHVDEDADRKYMIEKIRVIKGVKKIDDQVQVSNKDGVIAYNGQSNHGDILADQELSRKVNDVLKPSFFGTQYDNVTATVSDGIVNLRGTVKSDEEKRDLLRKVNNVPGIKSVNDQVSVR